MCKKLNSEVAYELLTKDVITTTKDFKEDKNKWILHCIYSGIAAGRIAKKLGLDSDYARALGYIHDIGRKISHPKHPIEGFNYMKEFGYETAANICLTHSFIDNDITLAAGPFPSKKAYDFINPHLQEKECDIYDNIIQLCDLFCLETGFTTIEKRILDISLRKGVFPSSARHFSRAIELKKRIEQKLGCNLYDLFEEISEEDLENANVYHEKLLNLFTTMPFKPLNIGVDMEDLFLIKNNFIESEANYNFDKLLRDGHKIFLFFPVENSKKNIDKITRLLDSYHINYTKLVLETSSDKSKECLRNHINIMYTSNSNDYSNCSDNKDSTTLIVNACLEKEQKKLGCIPSWSEIYEEVNLIASQQLNADKQKKLVKNN